MANTVLCLRNGKAGFTEKPATGRAEGGDIVVLVERLHYIPEESGGGRPGGARSERCS